MVLPMFVIAFLFIPSIVLILKSNQVYKTQLIHQAGTVEASYWLAIEKVSDEEEPADNFWEEKTNQERAKKLLDVKLATEAWEIVSIEAEGPTNLEDCDEDTVFEMHYHEAEDCGESIGFWLSNQDSNTVYHT